ncbi:MAG TPA: isoprenylcysteine carboxylmethyltransferase family protein [Dehalococcoidia bacterium]|nr:isoprenylcysteine carboxylmethyltransferase family protein [Dehalococcoidia bacterium]
MAVATKASPCSSELVEPSAQLCPGRHVGRAFRRIRLTHGQALLDDHRISSFPFVIEQSILVFLFLIRRESRQTSRRTSDWIVAAIGGWGTLGLRPLGEASGWVEATGIGIQAVGVSLAAVAFMNLGRSLGVVAASRGRKTGGLYVLVRHPIYTAHILTISGFLLANPHAWNYFMATVVVICLVLQIGAEERLLSETDDYRRYREKVQWRLVPKVY